MVDYKERLQAALSEAGIDERALAKGINVTYQAIYKVIRGLSKSLSAANNDAAAAFLGVSSKWLATGKGPMRAPNINVINVTERCKVPLITWQNISHKGDFSVMQQPTTAEEWVNVYESVPSAAAYALEVTGDVMVSSFPGEASFPPGTIIIVDPAIEAKAGDYVLAMDPVSGHPTFKRLVHDAGRWYLKPSNPAYPATEVQSPVGIILGRVMESHIRRKL